MKHDMRVLVSGAGSIGRRHARNLRQLGIEHISICDPTEISRQALMDELQIAGYASLTDALAKESPAIVFICSPTKLHMNQALEAATAGTHLFIEKPLSHTRENLDALKALIQEKNLLCMVGCNMRFHFGPKTVKRLLDEGVIRKVHDAEVVTASFLPDWRPEQNYKESYSADPLQGGAILDCIHELDLALWYLGPATLNNATLAPATELGIDVEGTADLALKHHSGATSHVLLSFMEKGYRRSCVIRGEQRTIDWDFMRKTVRVTDANGTIITEEREPEGYDINQMYLAEVSSFLDCVRERKTPMGNLAEAIDVLTLALEAKSRRS